MHTSALNVQFSGTSIRTLMFECTHFKRASAKRQPLCPRSIREDTSSIVQMKIVIKSIMLCNAFWKTLYLFCTYCSRFGLYLGQLLCLAFMVLNQNIQNNWSMPWLLTHWGRDKMAAIIQTFSNGFSWMKMYQFRLKFHWSLFLGVQLLIFQHRFR